MIRESSFLFVKIDVALPPPLQVSIISAAAAVAVDKRSGMHTLKIWQASILLLRPIVESKTVTLRCQRGRRKSPEFFDGRRDILTD